MSRILFENKKVALGFAGAIIVGAAIFSGTSDVTSDTGDRSRLAEAPQGFNGPAARAASKSEEDVEAEKKEEIKFADDEELIDSANGFDPTPGGSSDDEEEDEEEQEEDEDEEEDERDPFNPFADLEDPRGSEGF